MEESIDELLTYDNLVVDASFVLAFLLPDETTGFVNELFLRLTETKTNLVSSYLLSFEVLNSLRSAYLTKRISKNLAFTLAKEFLRLGVKEEEVEPQKVLKISFGKNITYYDATYVYLSFSFSSPLLSLDNKLTKLSL